MKRQISSQDGESSSSSKKSKVGNKHQPLHIISPLIRSPKLSNLLGSNVWLKLDNTQPAGSFKIRGIGQLCQRLVLDDKKSSLICASGGNAGLATVFAARELNVPVTIVLPSSTPLIVNDRLREIFPDSTKLEIITHGSVWDEANQLAMKLSKERNGGYVAAFDDPELWNGHSTIIHELKEQFTSYNPTTKPDLLITVVGGGGLLCGICEGLDSVGWHDVNILTCETDGAQSFHEAVKAGKLVTLPAITSIAKTLGAKTVCSKAFECSKSHNIKSIVLSDKQAVNGLIKFGDDHRYLVEPSCGVGLASIYESNECEELLQSISKNNSNNKSKSEMNVVVIVCGGSSVNFSMIEDWKLKFA